MPLGQSACIDVDNLLHAGRVLKETHNDTMANEEVPTRICLKMKQVILETPVEYDAQITTRIPKTEKARLYRRAKKEGIKPSELHRRIVSREMKNWKDTDQEDETRTEDESREPGSSRPFERT